MQVVVSGSLAVVLAPLQKLAGARLELERALGQGGDLARTKVRRALKEQTNVTHYGVVAANTVGSRQGLIYQIIGSGKGLKIEEFPLRLSRSRKMWVRWSPREHWRLQARSAGGRFGVLPDVSDAGEVYAVPWGVGREFVRSFVKPSGALRQANPGGDAGHKWRFRALFGPSIAKEIVKDQSLAAFERSVQQDVMPVIEARIRGLLA